MHFQGTNILFVYLHSVAVTSHVKLAFENKVQSNGVECKLSFTSFYTTNTGWKTVEPPICGHPRDQKNFCLWEGKM